MYFQLPLQASSIIDHIMSPADEYIPDLYAHQMFGFTLYPARMLKVMFALSDQKP
jgi:hypothetical protein